MKQQWYIAKNRQKVGPFSIEQMQALVTESKLFKSDMVLEISQKKWRLAETVEGIFSSSNDNKLVNITPESSVTPNIPFSEKQLNEQWYIARNKQKVGPFSTFQMQQMATLGELLRNEMVLDNSQKKWCLVETVEDIFPSVKKYAAPIQPPLPTLRSSSLLSRYQVLIGTLMALGLMLCGYFWALYKQKIHVPVGGEMEVAENSKEHKSQTFKQEPSTPKKKFAKPEESKSPGFNQEQKDRSINDDKIRSIIDQLLGEPLEHYKDFGFKDIILGSDYSSLKDSHNVIFGHPTFTSIVFLDDKSLAANRYVFNGTDKLVGYTKVLKGDINDYADRIVEIFGKTNQEIEGKFIKYTFEKTLVSITSQTVGTMRDSQVLTAIQILDKKWIEEVLIEYATNAFELLEWQKETAGLIINKDFDLNAVLKLPETIIEPYEGDTDKKTFRLVYPKTPERNLAYLGLFGHMFPPDYVTSRGDEKFKKIPVISVNTAIRLKSIPKKPQYELKKFEDISNSTPFPDFAALTVTNYAKELLLFLLQMHYPPKTKNIEVITPRYGGIIKRWKTKEGWHVLVNNNEVILSFLGANDEL